MPQDHEHPDNYLHSFQTAGLLPSVEDAIKLIATRERADHKTRELLLLSVVITFFFLLGGHAAWWKIMLASIFAGLPLSILMIVDRQPAETALLDPSTLCSKCYLTGKK